MTCVTFVPAGRLIVMPTFSLLACSSRRCIRREVWVVDVVVTDELPAVRGSQHEPIDLVVVQRLDITDGRAGSYKQDTDVQERHKADIRCIKCRCGHYSIAGLQTSIFRS